MKVFALDQHSYNCSKKYCHKRHFIFQYDFRFYMIVYCDCMDYVRGNIDWKQDMMIMFTSLKKTRKEILRSRDLKNLMKERNFDSLTSKKFDEVCWTYVDNAGKEYCFVNKMTFTKYLASSIGYSDRLRDVKKKLDDLQDKGIITGHREFYEDQAWDLFTKNEDPLEDLSDIQKVKLTDLLSKNFIKQIQHDNNSYLLAGHEASPQ